MDIDFHPGVNGSSPYVNFYPYTPSATAGYAFMAMFGIATISHFVLMIPYRAAYFTPLFLGGVCTFPRCLKCWIGIRLTQFELGETFGYYGRAWSHKDRREISSWALQEMLILSAPALIAATVYMVLGRIIRCFGAEHLVSMTPKKITVIFVLNDVLTFCTQLGGAGVQVTGDANVMAIGKKVVLSGLIFSLVVFSFFIWIAASLHRRLLKNPTDILVMNSINWQQYMWTLYAACFALMLRNLVRTIQFGAPRGSAVNQQEWWIYAFDGFLMFFSMSVLVVYHPGLLIKKARRLAKVADFHEPLRTSDIPLTQCEPRMMAA
ncbi:RTA-like protein [Penicillium verrucosum]|uniref:RTA-like protein n=1 Tax=Penicillium verrucosum TaxID=60171 RepID=UPI00254588D8|nr:RTA-like protein [Penicillium verrucosum]KAJ5943444.1 RTA-like protein [Penicillium verrucosum]